MIAAREPDTVGVEPLEREEHDDDLGRPRAAINKVTWRSVNNRGKEPAASHRQATGHSAGPARSRTIEEHHVLVGRQARQLEQMHEVEVLAVRVAHAAG